MFKKIISLLFLMSITAFSQVTPINRGKLITDLDANSKSITNLTYAIKTPFYTNYTVSITNQVVCCIGTNQLITLPNITNTATTGRLFVFLMSSTNGYGSAIITNANGVQTVRTSSGLSETITNGQSLTLISDGTNWRLKFILPLLFFCFTASGQLESKRQSVGSRHINVEVSSGTNFYASPTGSSGNTGLSVNSPWPIDYALSHAGSSNTVLVMDGFYPADQTFNTAYLTVKAVNKWGAIFTNGTAGGGFALYPSPAHHIIVDGLCITNCQGPGILAAYGTNNTFRNLWIKKDWISRNRNWGRSLCQRSSKHNCRKLFN
jgi:hypothetical protein